MKTNKIIYFLLISFIIISINCAHAMDDDQAGFERRRPILRECVEEILTSEFGFQQGSVQQFTREPNDDIKKDVLERELPKHQESWDSAQLHAEAEKLQMAGDIKGYIYYRKLALDKEKEENPESAEEKEKRGGENHLHALLVNSVKLMADPEPDAGDQAMGNLYRIGESDLAHACSSAEKDPWYKRSAGTITATCGLTAVAATIFVLVKVFAGPR